LSMLNENIGLKPGMKILSTVAGVGGNYGAFIYVVPESKKPKAGNLHIKDLLGKNCLVCGASGALGSEISIELGRRGAHVILHYNQGKEKALETAKKIQTLGGSYSLIQADFLSNETMENLYNQVISKHTQLHYLVHAAGIIIEGKNKEEEIVEMSEVMQINCFRPIEITKKLYPILKETVLYIGTAAEDVPIKGFSEFVSSKSCLHGFAGSAAGEYLSKGIRSLYYMPALLSAGISKKIDPKSAFQFMMKNGQEEAIPVKHVAFNMVSSLYIPKVLGTTNHYENALLCRKDGYVLETDV